LYSRPAASREERHGGLAEVVVHRLDEGMPAARKGHDGRAGDDADQALHVPVARVAVDHRWPQDRPFLAHCAHAVLGGQASRPRCGGEPSEERGGREEHGPTDSCRLHGTHHRLGVPEAQGCDMDEANRALEEPCEP
jgi:hypothetical protein